MLLRTIIIPAYAEEPLIEDSLQRLHVYLKKKRWLASTEVIVVTADAPDNTVRLAGKALKVFPHRQHICPGARAGKGRDVRVGMQAARGAHILFMDADLATPLHHVERAFDLLTQHGGMVIGVRAVAEMHNSLLRKISSLVSNVLIRALVSWRISDSQCGFKGFDVATRDALVKRATINGWGFDFEFIKIARVQRIRITQLLINDWKDPKPVGTGLSGDSQMRAMIGTLKELIKVKKQQLQGAYK